MGEFSWAYISGGAGQGPNRSVQMHLAENASLSGTRNFTYDFDTDTLNLSGSMEISGTLTANQYNINIVDKTVTNLSASGDTKFGDTFDDTHQFTGSVLITSSLMVQDEEGSEMPLLAVNRTHISSSLNISGSAFYGDGSNLSGLTANSISGSKGSFNTVDGIVTLTGSADFEGIVGITGSLELTGSGQALIVLKTHDADNLKEIVFNKAGQPAAAIQINSAEHMFVENENAKDIILRANNQNVLRVIGSERKVIIGAVTKTSAFAELDVQGSGIISGSLQVSGSSIIGNLKEHVATVGGQLTASQGITLGDTAFVPQNTNIIFGTGSSAIQYNKELGKLVISGSLGAGGIDLQGGEVTIDFPGGTIASGSLAGAGSFVGLNNQNRLVLSSVPPAAAAGSNTEIQFNNSGNTGASSNFTFDSADNELELKGTLEVVSGSGATERTVFQVDSSGATGASGSVRGRMIHVKETLFDLTSGAQARTGRYVSIGPSTIINSSLTRNNGFISPFSGRVISITYQFGAGPTNQDQSKGQCGFALRTADVNTLNGNSMDSAVSNTSFVTASTWPGQNRVGSINVQTGDGALHGLGNVTGSWSFGTGSAVGLYFQSNDSSGVNFPGQCAFTIVFEFDQLDLIRSGSGN